MKLIHCPKCGDFFALPTKLGKTKTCRCRGAAGKYLSDGMVAVITENCIVAGIDNNTFSTSVYRYNQTNKDHPDWPRLDFFFTGWIPTKPGEVIRVNTVKEVKEYPFEVEVKTVFSTMPVST